MGPGSVNRCDGVMVGEKDIETSKKVPNLDNVQTREYDFIDD